MNELWKNILAELEMDPEIRGATFKAWFLDSKLLSFENNQAVIGVRNSFASSTITKKYLENIKNAFQKNGEICEKISFTVISFDKQSKEPEKILPPSPKKPSVEELIKSKNQKK